jgi:uncharacterized protein
VILIDVNILIYAVDADSSHHRVVAPWFEGVLNRAGLVGLPWIVIQAFLRITTRAGLLRTPLAVEDAVTYCQSWLDLPSVRILAPGDRHWPIFRNLLLTVGTAGNLTSDVHLAALALENGCTICSTDNDFKRFPGVRHLNPLTSKA